MHGALCSCMNQEQPLMHESSQLSCQPARWGGSAAASVLQQRPAIELQSSFTASLVSAAEPGLGGDEGLGGRKLGAAS